MIPIHLDPTSWTTSIVASGPMLLSDVVQARREGPSPSLRLLLGFQCALAAITAVGLLAYAVGFYDLLAFYPFRTLISRATYPLPVLHREAEHRVYDLSGLAVPAGPPREREGGEPSPARSPALDQGSSLATLAVHPAATP